MSCFQDGVYDEFADKMGLLSFICRRNTFFMAKNALFLKQNIFPRGGGSETLLLEHSTSPLNPTVATGLFLSSQRFS